MELTTPARADEAGAPARPARRVCEQAAKRGPRLQGFLTQALETEWRGPLPARHREPPQAGALPVAQDPRPVRLRLPAPPRPQAGARAGRAQLRRARRTTSSCSGRRASARPTSPSRSASRRSRPATRSLFLTLETLMTPAGPRPAREPARAHAAAARLPQGADPRRDRLPAALARGGQPVLPAAGAPLRAGEPDRHQQQELRRLGRDLQRPGPGHRDPRPAAAPRHHAQHQGRELPAQGEAPGRAVRPSQTLARPTSGSRRSTPSGG